MQTFCFIFFPSQAQTSNSLDNLNLNRCYIYNQRKSLPFRKKECLAQKRDLVPQSLKVFVSDGVFMDMKIEIWSVCKKNDDFVMYHLAVLLSLMLHIDLKSIMSFGKEIPFYKHTERQKIFSDF